MQDLAGRQAAVLDSGLDHDAAAGRSRHDSADAIVDFVRGIGPSVSRVIDMHVHVDHLSTAPYVQMQLRGRLGGRAGRLR